MTLFPAIVTFCNPKIRLYESTEYIISHDYHEHLQKMGNRKGGLWRILEPPGNKIELE